MALAYVAVVSVLVSALLAIAYLAALYGALAGYWLAGGR